MEVVVSASNAARKDNEITYPCLRQTPRTGVVYLFPKKFEKAYDIVEGYYSCVCITQTIPFKGSVTITQE